MALCPAQQFIEFPTAEDAHILYLRLFHTIIQESFLREQCQTKPCPQKKEPPGPTPSVGPVYFPRRVGRLKV